MQARTIHSTGVRKQDIKKKLAPQQLIAVNFSNSFNTLPSDPGVWLGEKYINLKIIVSQLQLFNIHNDIKDSNLVLFWLQTLIKHDNCVSP